MTSAPTGEDLDLFLHAEEPVVTLSDDQPEISISVDFGVAVVSVVEEVV